MGHCIDSPLARSFILMAFHPSVTDTMGALHLARQFLITLDRILEEDSSGSTPDGHPGKRERERESDTF